MLSKFVTLILLKNKREEKEEDRENFQINDSSFKIKGGGERSK